MLAIWYFFGVGILKLWGYSDDAWLRVQAMPHDGFEIGAVSIVPLHVAIGLAIFSLFLTGIRSLKRKVLPHWVGRTRLDRVGRDAVIALTG